MKKLEVSTALLWLLVGGSTVLFGTGCGSDSKATATFPGTPVPPALRQAATPRPTATALPAE
jgi:hypothetical protein